MHSYTWTHLLGKYLYARRRDLSVTKQIDDRKWGQKLLWDTWWNAWWSRASQWQKVLVNRIVPSTYEGLQMWISIFAIVLFKWPLQSRCQSTMKFLKSESIPRILGQILQYNCQLGAIGGCWCICQGSILLIITRYKPGWVVSNIIGSTGIFSVAEEFGLQYTLQFLWAGAYLYFDEAIESPPSFQHTYLALLCGKTHETSTTRALKKIWWGQCYIISGIN